MANNGTDGTVWNESAPVSTDLRSNGYVEIRSVRVGVGLRILKEHDTFADSSVGGEHKKGSARAYYQTGDPSQRPDASTNLGSSDDGRLLVHSSTKALSVYTGSSFTAVTTSIAATAVGAITRTVVNSSDGFTNPEGASIFLTFQGVHSVNMLVEIDITGSSGWVNWLNSNQFSGTWFLHGGVILADGAKVRVSPFDVLFSGLDFHYMKLG